MLIMRIKTYCLFCTIPPFFKTYVYFQNNNNNKINNNLHNNTKLLIIPILLSPIITINITVLHRTTLKKRQNLKHKAICGSNHKAKILLCVGQF